jgi:Flp pilus assembly pilin Flp
MPVKTSGNPPLIKVRPPWIGTLILAVVSVAIIIGCAEVTEWSVVEVSTMVALLAVMIIAVGYILADRMRPLSILGKSGAWQLSLSWAVRAMAWPGLICTDIAGVCIGFDLYMSHSGSARQSARGITIFLCAALMLIALLVESLFRWELVVGKYALELSRPRGFYVIEKSDLAEARKRRTVMGIAVPAWVFVDGEDGQYVIRDVVDLPVRGWKAKGVNSDYECPGAR